MKDLEQECLRTVSTAQAANPPSMRLAGQVVTDGMRPFLAWKDGLCSGRVHGLSSRSATECQLSQRLASLGGEYLPPQKTRDPPHSFLQSQQPAMRKTVFFSLKTALSHHPNFPFLYSTCFKIQSSLHRVKAELLSSCKPQGCVATCPVAPAALAAPAAMEEEVAHGPVPLVTILQDPSAIRTPASAGWSKCRHSTRWSWRIKYRSVRKHERHKQ